jgi:hypothetical protein
LAGSAPSHTSWCSPSSERRYPTMSLARASWIITVVVCAIAALAFALSGYTGYTITLVAVGLAAAVNLLPPA